MPVWSTDAPSQVAVDLWQVSQAAVVCTWPVGLPVAIVPLWQDAQAPTTWLWSTFAPVQTTVEVWQFSHKLLVAM